MIAVQARLDVLTERLRTRAVALARARAATRLLHRRSDHALWRTAALLWPLFAKG